MNSKHAIVFLRVANISVVECCPSSGTTDVRSRYSPIDRPRLLMLMSCEIIHLDTYEREFELQKDRKSSECIWVICWTIVQMCVMLTEK